MTSLWRARSPARAVSPPRGGSRRKDRAENNGALSIQETSANGSTSAEEGSSRSGLARQLPLQSSLLRTEPGPACPSAALSFAVVPSFPCDFYLLRSHLCIQNSHSSPGKTVASAAHPRQLQPAGGGVGGSGGGDGGASAPQSTRRRGQDCKFRGGGKWYLWSYAQGAIWILPCKIFFLNSLLQILSNPF